MSENLDLHFNCLPVQVKEKLMKLALIAAGETPSCPESCLTKISVSRWSESGLLLAIPPSLSQDAVVQDAMATLIKRLGEGVSNG